MSAMTLTDFLLARIAEDEAMARDAATVDNGTIAEERGGSRYTQAPYWCAYYLNDYDGGLQLQPFASDEERNARLIEALQNVLNEEDGETCHISRHDPARVLAGVERDRRIVALHHPVAFDEERWASLGGCVCRGGSPCPTLRALAIPYADHRDYREEWRP